MKTLILALVILLSLNVNAQQTIPKPPCTALIIPSNLGTELEQNFNALYYNVFSKIGYDTTISFPIKIIDSLFSHSIYHNNKRIKGFRIYFAEDNNNTFRFIFTGVKKTRKDTKKYYALNNSTESYDSIDFDTANIWVKNFQQSMLLKTLDTILGDRNTRTYVYMKLTEMLRQLSDFESQYQCITRVKFKFGAFNNMDTLPKTHPVKYYKNRIMVGFTFTDDKGNELDISDPNSSCGCQISITKNFSFIISADTGTPCPPGTGCGTSSLPK